jgi:NifU-like protein involved in Fe-S cluster formation
MKNRRDRRRNGQAFLNPMRRWFYVAGTCIAILQIQAAMAEPLTVSKRTMRWPYPADATDQWYMAQWKKGNIVMPFITSPETEITSRINDDLYFDLIGIPAPAGHGKTFDVSKDIPSESDHPPLIGIDSMNFDVKRNDGRIFSVSVERDGCGASCEEFSTFYNFDLSTGKRFDSTDVINENGKAKIVRMMDRQKEKLYSNMIKELESDLKRAEQEEKHSRQPRIASGDIKQRIDLNKWCLEQVTRHMEDSSRNLSEEFDSLPFFLPNEKSVRFTYEHCSSHADRALDDVGDISLTIPNEKLRGLLTDYGKYLLLGEDQPKRGPSPYDVFLHGKIGQSAMTIRISTPEKDRPYSAVYYYDSYRHPIYLSGKMDGSKLVLSSSTEETFELTQNGTSFSGQWHKQGKQLPVHFAL